MSNSTEVVILVLSCEGGKTYLECLIAWVFSITGVILLFLCLLRCILESWNDTNSKCRKNNARAQPYERIPAAERV